MTKFSSIFCLLLTTSAFAMEPDSLRSQITPSFTQHLSSTQLQKVDILNTPLTAEMSAEEIKEIGSTAYPYYELFLKLENLQKNEDKVSPNKSLELLESQLDRDKQEIHNQEKRIETYKEYINKAATYTPGLNEKDDLIFGVKWYPEGITKDGRVSSYRPQSPYQGSNSQDLQTAYDAHFKRDEFRARKVKEFEEDIKTSEAKITSLVESMSQTAKKIEQEKEKEKEKQLEESKPILETQSGLTLPTIMTLKNVFRNIANSSIRIIIETKPNASDEVLKSVQENNQTQTQKALKAYIVLQEALNYINISAEDIRKIYNDSK
ncbi:hypothetical protein [Candidatus Paracaedibacter symbiosus]|uniref:hypothetical protein n=1 Tax=Candidatus Paracaedibacter symbiosus TaxID=244582 RepID=UPI00050989D6|nr:hypothetical protein [Candidatus Paracaedibacter symbiosus]